MSEEERAAPAPLAAPVGPRLRAAREARGLAVADVAGHLKIGPKKVEAIEAGDADAAEAAMRHHLANVAGTLPVGRP